MTKVTKHPRKSGATTIKKDGKIVGNIGAGKRKIPTAKNSVDSGNQKKTENIVSPLTAAQIKFSTLTAEDGTINIGEQKISSEAIQVMLDMTRNQPIEQRLVIFSRMLNNMKTEDQEDIARQLGEIGYEEKNGGVFLRYKWDDFLREDATSEMLHLLVHDKDIGDGCYLEPRVLHNPQCTTESLDIAYPKIDKNWNLSRCLGSEHLPSHPNASAELAQKVLDTYDDNGLCKSVEELSVEDKVQKSLIVHFHLLQNSRLTENMIENISKKVEALAELIDKKNLAEYFPEESWREQLPKKVQEMKGFQQHNKYDTADRYSVANYIKEIRTQIVTHPKTSSKVVKEVLPKMSEHALVDIIKREGIKATNKKLAIEGLVKKLQ